VIGVAEREGEETVGAKRPGKNIRRRMERGFAGNIRSEGGMAREDGGMLTVEKGITLRAGFVESDLRERGKTVLKWLAGFAFLCSSEYHVVLLRQQRTLIAEVGRAQAIAEKNW
jgi:hypothetical protein